MLLGRVLLRSTCSAGVCVQAVCSANERTIRRLHHSFTSRRDHVNSLIPPGQHISLKVKTQSCLHPITVRNMEPVGISYCNNTTTAAAASGDEDDEGGGAEEDVAGEMRVTGTPEAVTMEVQEEVTEKGASKISRLSEKKRKVRRERRKPWKKKLELTELSDSLMSELPFALTSPTAWKELGFSNQDSCQKKRKRKRGDSGGRVDSEEDADKRKKKKESQRPNYFVSIPITNTQISSSVAEVQEALLEREPLFAKAMIPIPTLHITLLVTHLASQEQVDLAATALARVAPSLAELLGGQDLVLPFSGISHFRKEVVFVGLAPGPHRHTLDSLAELLRSRFEEEGLLQGEGRGFEPHLTIMKLSRASKLRSQGIKRVDPALYSNYTNRFFGDQTVERLDLCSMLKKKQPDGYYHTETSLKLSHFLVVVQ